MKLKLKFPKVQPPRLVNEFKRYRIVLSPIRSGEQFKFGTTRGQRVIFPDLPFRFFLSKNGLGGHTITELRTGLALHKGSSHSVELSLIEATSKLEQAYARFGGPKGLIKHVRSLPSKQEIVSSNEPPAPRLKEAARKKPKGMSLSRR